jgi:hypothetical protein
VGKNDATLTKRWALLSAPYKFNVDNAKWMLALVVGSGGARGERGEGGEGESAMYFCTDSSCSWGHGVFFGDAMWVVQRSCKGVDRRND